MVKNLFLLAGGRDIDSELAHAIPPRLVVADDVKLAGLFGARQADAHVGTVFPHQLCEVPWGNRTRNV